MSRAPQQRRTQRARETLAAQFSSPEEKSEHYRRLAQRGHEGRVVLSADEVAALSAAYGLLRSIAARHEAKLARAAGAVREGGAL